MIRNSLFAVLVLIICSQAASLIGLEALGKSNDGLSAPFLGRGNAGHAKTGDGLSLWNPAILAFEEKVSFVADISYETVAASNGDVSYSTTSFDIPSLMLSFPLGRFGAIAVGVVQEYSSNLRVEVSDSSTSNLAKLEYQGSLFELTPTYALRLPFFRRISLGFTGHFVMGGNSRELTLGADNSAVAEDDAWATNNSELTDNVDGTWEIKNHPAYYTGSAEYKGRDVSYYLSYTTAYVLANDLEYNFEFSQLDTLVPTKITREIDVPATFATGVNYQFLKRHNVMFDFMFRGWDKKIPNLGGGWNLADSTETQTEFLAAIGYQRDGSSVIYDKFWEKITYRLGAWTRNWYISDVTEYGGALGVGIPLGRRGTQLDIAVQGGLRESENDSFWDEKFVGITLGLTGVGSWGVTPRNYR